MDLLDRYLQAVKKHLPWQRQDDIIAELRANLESQLEDKETELGRPLTTEEVEAWLKHLGPPMQVAARYQPQQYLIGPAVFPTYWFVLRLAFLWATIIYSIVSAVLIVSGTANWTAVLEAMLRLPVVLMTTATWITLVFAAIEFVVIHYPEKFPAIAGNLVDWSPATMPPLEKASSPGKKPRSYAHAVAEVVFGFIFLIWLLLIPQYPVVLFGPGAVFLHLSPFQLTLVWYQFFWWVVALNTIQLAWRCIELWSGSWQEPRPVRKIVTNVFGLIPLVMLLTAPDHALVVLKHPLLDTAHYGGTADMINQGINKGLLVICAIIILQLAWDIGQMGLEIYRKRRIAMR